MNVLILEWNKFIKSKLFIVIFAFIVALFGSIFYTNYIDFQQIDIDKKEEIFNIKKDIGNILYPQVENEVCIYSGDENKIILLTEAYEISEEVLKSKYRDDGKTFMNKAILLYEKIIELKDNKIDIKFPKNYAEYEKNRLIEINKVNGEFQYEKAPLNSTLIEYNIIKYILGGIFFITLFYFLFTIYLDFVFHKGFLFTLPIDKKRFIFGKAVISFFINLVLIISQFFICCLFGKIWKWESNFNYPVFDEGFNRFVPVKDMFFKYIKVELVICVIFLLISSIIFSFYLSMKNRKYKKL